jgi:hypothetical protein
LVEADHVKSVQEIQKPGKMTEIEGRCVRQTSVTETSYYINLQLDDNRNIIRAFCLCIAGARSNNNKTKCKPVELCKLSLVKIVQNRERSFEEFELGINSPD